MKKEILKLGKALTQAEQKAILGGISGEIRMGVCIVNGISISVRCDQTCPNGSKPFCFAWDDEIPM